MTQNKIASIDFESAGLYDSSVVLSMGLVITDYSDSHVTFDELIQGGLYLRFDYKEQIGLGRTTEPSVMQWWKEKPSQQARDEAWGMHGERVSIRELPALIKAYLDKQGIDPKKVDWYDRNMFDMTKLQHITEVTLGVETFWDYQAKFEFATALRFLGSDRYGGIHPSDFPEGVIYHHPLHDAAIDHLRIMKAMHTMPV